MLPALFKEHGIEVLDSLTYRTKDTDYSAQVTKAKSLGAEGIGLGSCYQNAGAIAKEMQKQGLNVPVVGGACAGAPGFIEIAGKAAEGAYMSTAAWLDDPRPEVQAYVKKIMAKMNGQQPPYSGPRSYDIIYSYKYCIEKSGVTNKPADLDADRDRIRGCLAELKNFPGVGGEITMESRTATAPAPARSSRWSTASTSTSPSSHRVGDRIAGPISSAIRQIQTAPPSKRAPLFFGQAR